MTYTTRLLICVIIGVAYFGWYKGQGVDPVLPTDGLSEIARQMTSEEREAVADFYGTFGRSLAGDPDSEPVFGSNADVRKAHRAGMLMLWKGALGNESGKYPELRKALEDFLAENVGLDNVNLSPERKDEMGQQFKNLGEKFR